MKTLMSDKPKSQGATPSLEDSLRRLAQLTSRLRKLGTAIVVLTFGSAIAYAGLMSGRLTGSSMIVCGIAAVAAVLGFLSVIVFDATRRRGDTLFDEISDELQWNIRQNAEARSDNYSIAPEFNVRVMMRDFIRATDLPLLPGKFGPALFAAASIALAIAALLAAPMNLQEASDKPKITRELI